MKDSMFFSRLLRWVALSAVIGCQTLPEQQTLPGQQANPQSLAPAISNRECESCGIEVTITKPPGQSSTSANHSPPASRPFRSAENRFVAPVTRTVVRAAEQPESQLQPTPSGAEMPLPLETARVDERTVKHVAELLTRLISPTEERQEWLADSPYIEDLDIVLAGAALTAPNDIAQQQPAQQQPIPDLLQVEHVPRQPATPVPPQAVPKRMPTPEGQNGQMPMSRAEYQKLVETLSALQATLQSQNRPPRAGDAATVPAQ